MGVGNTVDVYRLKKGNNFPRIVPITDVFISDVSFKHRVRLNEPLGPNVVISQCPDKSRKSLLVLAEFVEDSFLGVLSGFTIFLITGSFEF